MTTLTIPRDLIKERELVIVPRRQYEELLKLRRIITTAKLTLAEKKDLERARKEYKRGEYITLNELEYGLGIASKKTR